MAGRADAQAPPAVQYRPVVVAQLGVSNLERSIEFYEGVLDMRVKERRDDLKFAHVETSVPGLEIGLSESPAPSVRDPRCSISASAPRRAAATAIP